MIGLGVGLTSNNSGTIFEPSNFTNLELFISSIQEVTHASNVVSVWGDINSTNKFVKFASGSEPTFIPSGTLFGPSVMFQGETGGDAMSLANVGGTLNNKELARTDGGYTICFIANVEGADSEGILFGSKTGNSSKFSWVDEDNVKLTTEGVDVNFPLNASINDDTYYSFIFVVEDSTGTNCTLYINNNQASAPANSNIENFVLGMIGGNNGAPRNASTQRIKQMIMYNKALSNTDRDLLYNNTISPEI